MSKASSATLAELHSALAREMKRLLEDGQVVVDKDTGEALKVSPGASYLNVIRQFLKDNNIENLPGQGDTAELAKTAKACLPFPTDADEFGLPN